MEKEFVDYNTALVLKELGFDEPCFGFYGGLNALGDRYSWNGSGYNKNSDIDDSKNFHCTRPLFQQAFRWFRKEHNLFGYSYPNDYQMYGYRIVELKNPENKELIYDWGTLNTSEEAELKCLKRLIEIVKKQKI
jgi:hypothetical protein